MNSTRARAAARAKARVRAKTKTNFLPKNWGWRIAGGIFVVWVSGSFVPDRISTRTAVVPTQEPIPTPDLTPLTTVKRFSESERRDIFRLVVQAQDQAHNEADAQIPTNTDSTTQKDVVVMQEIIDANMKLADELMDKYRPRYYKRFPLSKKEVNLIGREGKSKQWPPL